MTDRREFLKTLASAGAASIIPGVAAFGQSRVNRVNVRGAIDVHHHFNAPGQSTGPRPWTVQASLDQMEKFGIGVAILSVSNVNAAAGAVRSGQGTDMRERRHGRRRYHRPGGAVLARTTSVCGSVTCSVAATRPLSRSSSTRTAISPICRIGCATVVNGGSVYLA
jgi:hypothetical protein